MNKVNLAYSGQSVALGRRVNTTRRTDARENLGVVDSLLHSQAILIRKVLTRSGRIDLNLILIDDEQNITRALGAGVEIHSLYYCSELVPAELLRNLPHGVKIYEIARRTCKKIFENDKISRVFALARIPAMRGLDGLLETPGDIVALEDLAISGNIGAIIRTSLAFGAGGLILLNAEPVDIYDRRLIRASRGHVFALPIITATTEEFLRFFEQRRLPIRVGW